MLFVVVDTEEEFDWAAPFSRENTQVRAMRRIDRGQRLFDRFGIKPTYVIDYPVARQRDGHEPLRDIVRDGRCQIGAHLHPWVNPPFTEEVSGRTSFGCNLPRELEAEKIRVLKNEIGERLGVDARIYKAGRYGFGASTEGALEELDFDIDVSVNPQMDFSREHGPSFTSFDAAPFFFGSSRALLEIPCTTGHTGIAGRFRASLHRLAASDRLSAARLVGVFARLGIVNKAMLSPEGFTLHELKALTTTLLKEGIRTFSLTFHSPSLQPGCTPYVKSEADLSTLVGTIDGYCEFFMGKLAGVARTPDEFFASVTQPATVPAHRALVQEPVL